MLGTNHHRTAWVLLLLAAFIAAVSVGCSEPSVNDDAVSQKSVNDDAVSLELESDESAAADAARSLESDDSVADDFVPTQEIQYDYVEGSESLEWIRDHSEAIITGRLVEIRPESFSRYDPESMDGIETVFRGLVFEPIEWFKGEPHSREFIVLDEALERDKETKKKTSFLVSDAYQMTEKDIGETFALFVSDTPFDTGGMYFLTSGRHGAVLVRGNGKVKVHRPDERENPWLLQKNAYLDDVLADLGLVGS